MIAVRPANDKPQGGNRPEAIRNIITGAIAVLIILGLIFFWHKTDAPKVVLLGGLIIGLSTLYKGVKGFSR
jgi:hypothetical protein